MSKDSNNIKTSFNNALLLYQNGKLNEAKDIGLKILKKNQNSFDVLYLLSIINFQQKNYKEAKKIIEKIIKINSSKYEIYNFYGVILVKLEQFEEALKKFNQAIKINSNDYEAYNNIGNVYLRLNRLDEALISYNKAIEIKSDYGDAYYNRGNVLEKQRKLDDAINSYDKAIKINPNKADAFNNRGNILLETKKLDASYLSYLEAYKIAPEKFFLSEQLIHLKSHLCDWKSIENDKIILKKKILKKNIPTLPFVVTTLFDSSSLQKISAEINVKNLYSNNNFLNPIIKKNNNTKIRIGYYSADFRKHATSYLLARLFELHDKSKFEIFIFSFISGNDEMYLRIKKSGVKEIIDVQNKTDSEIAQLSRDLNIDIAVDLMGFTKHNRIKVFANKCAPIQVNFLGYPGTSGSNFIDYIISDKIIITKENQKNFSEKIIYLPNTYQPNDSQRKISSKIFSKNELGLPEKGFIFCCFNGSYKIMPNVFNIWMRLLKNVKNSVLWLIKDNPTAVTNLKKEAKLKNINPDRIIFAEITSLPNHLARHKYADLFIDTFPCTAHTTCSDALWAGLPVLTRIGESMVSRVPGSLLSSIGLSELITYTEQEYENLAIELAINSSKLEKIKQKLKKNILSKPLFNSELYKDNIEEAYSIIYKRYIQNKKPTNIQIK